jgi:tRNA pseudouridine38-40 synthase
LSRNGGQLKGQSFFETMQRYKIKIAYDGTLYCGFQRQQSDPTIQKALEESLAHLDQAFVQVVGASRTDAKVHAMGQIAHFDLATVRDSLSILKAINARLPKEIRVLSIEPVSPDFHARFHAKKKVYTYTLSTAFQQSPFHRFHTLHFPHKLDLSRLDLGCQILKGTHDFKQFANTTTEKNRPPSTVRTLFDLSYEIENEFLILKFAGDGFLYNMVRNLAGALLETAQNRLSLETLSHLLGPSILERSFTTMPAHALCLEEIFY